jgi:hypothetical protein
MPFITPKSTGSLDEGSVAVTPAEYCENAGRHERFVKYSVLVGRNNAVGPLIQPQVWHPTHLQRNILLVIRMTPAFTASRLPTSSWSVNAVVLGCSISVGSVDIGVADELSNLIHCSDLVRGG